MSGPIGFVGFGEAGYHLAKGLAAAGAGPLLAYDLNWQNDAKGERIRLRAEEVGVGLVKSPAALSAASDTLLSVVTADVAISAAREYVPYLRSDLVYADLNSVSPESKREIAGVIGRSFVEGAILMPVPPHGHRAPILLNGPSAPLLESRLSRFGMRLETMDAPIGAAAAVKMCRSIVVKGLEALMLECMLAATRYGAADRVFASLDESFPSMNWRQLAWSMIGHPRAWRAAGARDGGSRADARGRGHRASDGGGGRAEAGLAGETGERRSRGCQGVGTSVERRKGWDRRR